VRVADASAPGLPASSYDVLGSSLVLFFLRDPAAAVATWADLLVPGGRLGVATFGPQDPRWQAVDALFSPYLPQQMLDARASGRRGPFGSDEGVEGLLREAGLVDVRTAHLGVGATLADPQHWLAFSWSHGQRAMWEHVPPDERPQMEQAAFALLEGFRGSDGSIVFAQDVRYTIGHRPA
jgi:SAM-dependent methyltransferase